MKNARDALSHLFYAKEKIINSGDEPYAVFCNSKTRELLIKRIEELTGLKLIGEDLEIEGLIVDQNEFLEDDRILVVNKNIYDQMKKVKGAYYDY